MKSGYKILSLALLLSLFFSLVSCTEEESEKKPQSYTNYEFFDTVCTFYSYAEDTEEKFLENVSEVEEILREYHKLFDIYYEYSGINNIRTINKNAGIAPVKVDEKLLDFFIFARDMYLLSNEEVNIVMGSVLEIWHACREEAEYSPERARVPDIAELTEAAAHTSIFSLVIDEENSTVYLSDPEASLDVGAIGKGYAAELAAKHLRNKGVSSYVLNIGGNICAIGTKPDGSGWTTGITNPDRTSDERFVTRITIEDLACVTSGDYERYYVANGKKYHHIIDKDTLMPSEYFSSVTVLTESSAVADMLSTALFNMTYEEGLNLLSKFQGSTEVDVLWVTAEGRTYMTDGFAERVIEEQ